MEKNKIAVYFIKNIKNNKMYIGSSSNVNDRWHCHKTKLRHNRHENKYLQSSWNKYGEKCFQFEIIEFVNIESLKEREMYYIIFYDVLNKNKGYNMCKDPLHSRLGLKNSESHNKKIGDANRGRKFTAEIVEANRLRNLGNHHSIETRKKMSESHKKLIQTESQLKNLKWNERSVIQKNINGDIIKKFNTITSANKTTGINNISAVCRGLQKTAGGFIWEYNNE